MTNDDKHIENYLAQFQPRPIRALNVSPQPKSFFFQRLAAAALLTLGTGLSLWHLYPLKSPAPDVAQVQPERSSTFPPQKKLSALELTKLALENSHDFDLYLLQQSRDVLPALQGENSTLRVLASE
jgi:hypothetical protein